MSTLVDELLADFEDSGSENGDNRDDGDVFGDAEGDDMMMGKRDGDMDLDAAADLLSSDEDEEMGEGHYDENGEPIKPKAEKSQLAGISDLRSAHNLIGTLDPVLEKIAFFQAQPPESRANVGNVEDHPEYALLTTANGLSTSIDSEIVLVHKYIRDRYSVRFPELETLITSPLEYSKAVAILGNGPLDADTMKAMPVSTNNPLGVSLESVLDKPTLMIVTTSAITSKGQAMPQHDLDRIVDACQTVMKLDKAKQTLTDYVQSRMIIFAPNLTAIVGSLTAAQLLNAAGGLTGLSKAPACNISAWGSKKSATAGALASNIGVHSQGFLYQSPIIKGVSGDMKKQAMRIVSAKLILAARVDRVHSAPDGSLGEEFRENCLERLEKLQAKPLNKGSKSLPVPDDKPSRKRGGRQARAAKAATALTDLQKARNRMEFNKEEKEIGYGVGDSTSGMGMIGASNDGRVRRIQIDQRTRAKVSAKSKGWGGMSTMNGGAASSLKGFGQTAGNLDLRGKGLRTSGVGTTVGNGGTMSSLAFTPVQGLELVDPTMRAENARKRKAEEDRWFKGGTFTQVGGSGGDKKDDGVFKKPDLPPARKKVDTGLTKG